MSYAGVIRFSPYWFLVIALLAWMGTAQILSVRQDAPTWDEGTHLAAGYSYWKTGDLRLNPEHPPFGKLLNALPLLWMHPKLPLDDPSWKALKEVEFANQFLFHNTIDAGTLLFAGRLVTIVMTVLFGLCLALWTRRRFGAPVALFALALFAFDPNLIAHGRYVTSDLLVALFYFLACVSWGEYLIEGRTPWLILAGVSLGLAISSKFSALILLPVFFLLYLARCWQRRPKAVVRHALRSFLTVGLLAYAVIVATYAPEARSFVPGIRLMNHSLPPARAAIRIESPTGFALRWITNHLALGRSRFFEGLSLIAWHNTRGREAYLLGRRSETGWWYYFPVVMLVKSPTGLLIGLAAATWIVARRLLKTRWREIQFAWFVLAIPVAVYFAAASSARIDLGVRHLLPVFPFLFVLVSAILWRHRSRAVLAVAVALVAIESTLIYPSYVAFFNLPSGGPGAGPRYLVDSNIDWGQDLLRLKSYLNRQGNPRSCLCYFGTAFPEYYGMTNASLPTTRELQAGATPNCVAAVSVTPLMGIYVNDAWSWVRDHRPIAKIGYSIYVYDFRKNGQAASPAPGK
ncbi:MAG: glycosyltransferase family 39 protein [Acidobacteriia bacterium]|nr:glycosyltransferase family 39 protein [Terriglobia bacterium]